MGVKASEAFQMMDAMNDVLSGEAVIAGTVDVFKLVGRDEVAV